MKKSISDLCDKLLRIKVFLVFNLLVFLAKIGYSIYYQFPGLYFEDWYIAENLAKFGTYSEFMNIGPTAYKLPIYPLFLSAFIWFSPEYAKEIVVITQHFIFFLAPILIIRILRLVNREKSGILAAYIFIFSPGYFYYSNVLEVTNVFIPAFIIWMYFYLKVFQNIFSIKDVVFLGISTGILFLTQVVVVPFAIVLLFALVFLHKIGFQKLMVIGAFAAICYSPWIIRNYAVFNKVILTKTPVWQNIYLSFTPINIWEDLNLISAENETSTFRMRRFVDEFRMEEVYREQTLQALKGNEQKYIKKGIQNAILIWFVPARYVYDNSASILFGRKVFVILLHLFSLAALVYIFRKNKILFWAFLLLFSGFTAPYMIGHAANMRFKLDFEWVQYILVSIFLYDLFCSRKSSQIGAST